ncbi:MAG: DUF4175 family protein [Candidatus Kapaibacteriales bacterium]
MINLVYSFEQLRRTLKKYKYLKQLYLFLIGLFNALFFSILTSIPIVFLEVIFQGDRSFRSSLFFLFILAFIGWMIYFLFPFFQSIYSSGSKITFYKLALEIGRTIPEVKDRLLNSFQLMEKLDTADGLSKIFILKDFENTTKLVEGKDFSQILDKKRLQSAIFRFAIALLVFLVFLFAIPPFSSAFTRIVNFNKSFLPPVPFSFKIYPKYSTAKRGDNVSISVLVYGTAPKSINLMIKEFQQKNFELIPLEFDSGNVYKYNIPSIKNSIKFFAETEWFTEKVQSDVGEIVVVDNPIIRTIKGIITFPKYTNKPQVFFSEHNPDIVALNGSKIDIHILANKKLSKAYLVFFQEFNSSDTTSISSSSVNRDSSVFSFAVQDEKASLQLIAKTTGSYYIQLEDLDGNKIENPIHNKIIVERDQFPTISILEPQSDVEIGEQAILPLMMSISDDYGFSALRIYYRLSYSDYSSAWKQFHSISIPFPENKTQANVPYIWDLGKLNISPSDEYEFFAEVADNDLISGPKTSQTSILRIKLPSLEDVLAKADKEQEMISKDLEKVLKQANEVKEQIQELQRELNQVGKKQELIWQEKKKAENILNRQKELSQKLADIQKSLEKLAENMTQKDLLSPETLQKYQELQKLLKEINSPELKELQRKLEAAISKLSPEEIQKAFQNYKFDEEQFRKNIERTLKIVKRLQAEQKIDALLKRAIELERKQADLQSQIANTNPEDQRMRDELARKQGLLRSELDKITNELKELERLMDEIGKDMPKDQLQEAEKELNPSETDQDMQSAQQSLNEGNFERTTKFQQKARQKLQNFANRLKKVKEEINNKITKEALRKLQKALNDVLTVANDQSILKQKTTQVDYNSTLIPELARQELSLSEAVANIANSLLELSQKSFAVTPEMARSLGEALSSMQEATQSISDRNLSDARSRQSQAIQALNNTAMQIQSKLSGMQGQGSCENPGGSGSEGKGGSFNFMQRLQQIASSQQMINQITRQLTNSNQGNLSPEQQAQLARIVAEQGRAQKALEELANEQKKFARPEERVLGNLRKVAEEMKEVVSNLQTGKIDSETLKKQDRILSRLLDATKSIYERDFEERRESTPGKELYREAPPPLELTDQQRKSLQHILDYLKQSYTKDYEELVRRYFLYLRQSSLEPLSPGL